MDMDSLFSTYGNKPPPSLRFSNSIILYNCIVVKRRGTANLRFDADLHIIIICHTPFFVWLCYYELWPYETPAFVSDRLNDL